MNDYSRWQRQAEEHKKEYPPGTRVYLESMNDPYLTKKGVHQMRSVLGQDIFKDDLQHIYQAQTVHRDALKKNWKSLLQDVMKQIERGNYDNPIVEQKLIELSERLSNTKAKKVYGYLQKDVKNLIDSIVDELAKDGRIAELYELWYEKKYEILKTYTADLPPKIPLSQNKEFKSIKNEIIRESMQIHSEGREAVSIDPLKKKGEYGKGTSYTKQQSSSQQKTVSALAVTRLFHHLARMLQNEIDDDEDQKISMIDSRQKREIDEKRNAEMSMG